MKLYKGLPSKKYIRELCDKYELVTRQLDMYSSLGTINFNPNFGANENAEKVIQELQKNGLKIEFRQAKKELALTGQIKILPQKGSA